LIFNFHRKVIRTNKKQLFGETGNIVGKLAEATLKIREGLKRLELNVMLQAN